MNTTALRSPILVAALALLTPRAAAHQNDITIDLGRGPVTVHVPDDYDPAKPAPLIILLHGYGASGALQESYMKFGPLVNQYGFLFVHPDGTVDAAGKPFWNATDACCDFFNTGIDDSGYLRSMIDAIKSLLTVDGRRVYFVGHSNGGFMSYRMACDHGDAVAAVASLAGATFFVPADCAATEPVHVLQIHGTLDSTILYGGGSLLGTPYPGAVETVERWATNDGCALIPDNSAPPIDLDFTIPGPETLVTRYEMGCAPGGSAELWSVVGGPHVPALTPQFAKLVVEWLYAHPKPGLDFERYCSPAVMNSSGLPGRMEAEGSDSIAANDLTLVATDLPVNQFGYFIGSQTQGFVPGPGGSTGDLCLGGNIARFASQIGNSGATGRFQAAIDLTSIPTHPPEAVLTGQTWRFQAWFRDGGTSNFTDGLSILFR